MKACNKGKPQAMLTLQRNQVKQFVEEVMKSSQQYATKYSQQEYGQ